MTSSLLVVKLREILEKWPLYRDFAYSGANEVFILPTVISLHCPACKKDQLWERQDYTVNDRTGFTDARYHCRNCHSEELRFYLAWFGKQETGFRIFKVGQYPPLEERIPPDSNNS